jgi:hypothetical protein
MLQDIAKLAAVKFCIGGGTRRSAAPIFIIRHAGGIERGRYEGAPSGAEGAGSAVWFEAISIRAEPESEPRRQN